VTVQIHWHQMTDLGAPERDAIEQRLQSLAEEHGDLFDVRISAAQPHHQRRGPVHVRIVAQVKGHELVSSHDAEQLSIATGTALDVFERELRKLRDRRQDRTRSPAPQRAIDNIGEPETAAREND